MTSAFRLRWLRAEPPAASSRPLRLAACLRTAAARAAGRRASAAQPGGWRQHAKTQHRLALLWGAHSLTACAPLRLPREGRQQRAGAAHRSTSASSRPPASSGMSAAAERRSRRPPARNATCVGQLSRPSKMCVAYARAGLGEPPQGPTAVGYRVPLPYPSPGRRRCASPACAPALGEPPRRPAACSGRCAPSLAQAQAGWRTYMMVAPRSSHSWRRKASRSARPSTSRSTVISSSSSTCAARGPQGVNNTKS